MTKLFILSDILGNDPESGYFYVGSVTYAINGKISRYTYTGNDGLWKKFPEIIQLIAERNGLKVDDLEVINLSREAEINIADLL